MQQQFTQHLSRLKNNKYVDQKVYKKFTDRIQKGKPLNKNHG